MGKGEVKGWGDREKIILSRKRRFLQCFIMSLVKIWGGGSTVFYLWGDTQSNSVGMNEVLRFLTIWECELLKSEITNKGKVLQRCIKTTVNLRFLRINKLYWYWFLQFACLRDSGQISESLIWKYSSISPTVGYVRVFPDFLLDYNIEFRKYCIY